MTRAIVALPAIGLAAFVATIAACPFGPSSSIIAGENVKVVVAGLAVNEHVRVDVDNTAHELAATDTAPLAFFFTVPTGHHVVHVVVGQGLSSQCGESDIDVAKGAVVARFFDAAQLPLCTAADVDAGPSGEGEGEGAEGEGEGEGGSLPDAGIPDAGFVDAGPNVGSFRELKETVTDAVCLTPPCTKITDAKSDGTLSVNDHGTITTGTVDDTDLEALAGDALAADALFAHMDATCVQTGGLLGLDVMQRTVINANGDPVTQSVDVSVCLTSDAQRLRSRLSFLVSLLGL